MSSTYYPEKPKDKFDPEEQFQPSIDRQTTQQLVNYYKHYPQKFDEEKVNQVELHAQHYRIAFARNDADQDVTVSGIIKQAGAGFGEGWSTFKMGDEPKNEWEAIARNVGHLAGFVGWLPVPAVGAAGKVGKLVAAANKLKGRSLPMLGANYLTKKAAPIARGIKNEAASLRGKATKDAFDFLGKGAPIAEDMVEGAFHLGTASAISAWQGGVDEMMNAFIGGAETGAVFRGIGNFIKTGNSEGDKLLRMVSASAYSGLPSTMAGQTTPEQVYHYLLGAYFGLKEMPFHTRQSRKFIAERFKDGKINEPVEAHPEFEKLDPASQKATIEFAEQVRGKVDTLGRPITANILVNELLKDIPGMSSKERTEMANKLLESGVTVNEYGEIMKTVELPGSEKPLSENVQKAREVSDSDVGTINHQVPLKIDSFVTRHMEPVWSASETPNKARVEATVDIHKEWNKILKRAYEEKTETPETDIVNYLQKKWGQAPKDEHTRWWRQYATTSLRDKVVDQLTASPYVKPGEDFWEQMPEGHTNRAGNIKLLREEPKEFDKVYTTAYLRKHGRQADAKSYAVLDHFTAYEGQRLKEIGLLDLAEFYARGQMPKNLRTAQEMNIPGAYRYAKEQSKIEGERMATKFHARNFYSLHKKADMYYYGGKGDAERMYFAKYHPDAPVNPTAPEMNQIRDGWALAQYNTQKKKTKSLASFKRQFTKEFNAERDEYVNTYGPLMREGMNVKQTAKKMFNRAFVSNAMYELELNGLTSNLAPHNVKNIYGPGMINSSKAYNKRAQIWFTTGHAGDRRIIEKEVPDLDIGRFKYSLIKDDSIANNKWNKDTPASEMIQGTDGAIYGRDDVIKAQNRDWGMSNEGSGHKSFIVSNSEPNLGALLGKYAVHQASPELNKWMHETGRHFIIPETAAKQFGLRETGILTRKKGQIHMEGGKDYFMLPSEMKGIFSERFDNHSLDAQRLPKQMMSNLTPYAWSRIKPETIEDMYDQLSRKSFHGDAELNAKLKLLMRDPTNEEYQRVLLNNVNQIGVKELLVAMKTPGLEKFATEVYRKIQRMDLMSDAEMALQEGEISKEEYERVKKDKYELNIVHEKIQELVGDSIAGMMHKYVTPYRQTIIRNWVVNQVVRPELQNSFAARMRPYEIGLRKQRTKGQNTSLLEKRDDIFFLDDNYKELKIYSEAWEGYRTLGEVWEDYNAGAFRGKVKRRVEESLNAVVQRTPMDSMSGAHKLKFKGFTGVKGIGVLLHPRAMEALGGADLDGDKAFGFFGGMSKDGSRGGGFKQEWMDMYDAQKSEFYLPDGTVSHNKKGIDPITGKQYSEILAITDEATLNKINSSVLKLSPLRRMLASMGAAGGRQQLGPAVVTKAVLTSAYAAIRATGKPFKVANPNKAGEFIVITPKTDKKSEESFRGITRASIALGSDPMDEAGLRGRELFFMEAAKRAFNFEVQYKNGTVNKRSTAYLNKSESMMRSGIIRALSRVNSVLFGKNMKEGRRWFPEEIQEYLEEANTNLVGAEQNTLFPKLAETLRGIDLSDSALRRVKFSEYEKFYAEHNALADKMGDLKEWLGRGSFKTPMNTYLKVIRDNKLYTQHGFETQLNDQLQGYSKNLFKGKAFDGFRKGRRKLDPENNLDHRRELMLDILAKGERYITDDISDFSSLRMLQKYSEGLPKERIKKIWEEADKIKHSSYLYARRKNAPVKARSTLSESEANFIKEMELQIAPEKISSALTKAETDKKIELVKRAENLNEQEIKLFESVLMGTYSRGTLHELNKRIEAYKAKSWSEDFKQEMNNLREMASNTSTTKIGIESEVISNSIKKEFFNNYKEIFDKSIDVVSPAEKARIKKEAAEVKDTPVELFDPKTGEKVKGQPLEASDYDAKTRKYIDEVGPFEGIKEGKLEHKEHRQLLASLKEKLDIAFPNIVGRDLNGLMRERFNKDINQVNIHDLKVLDRWLNDTLNGSWFQKTFKKVSKGLPALSKWHYNMFPEAVNQDLMRKEILLLERRGIFKDSHGNVISGRIMKPTGIMELIQDYVHKGQEWSIDASESEKGRFREELAPYMNLNKGYELHEIAIALREINVPKKWKEKYETLDNGMYLWIKEAYEKAYREIPKKHDWQTLKKQAFLVQGKDKVISMSGEEVVNKINEFYTKKNEEAHQWLTGKPEALNEYKALRVDSQNKKRSDYDYYRAVTKKFLKDIVQATEKGERFNMDLGIDGLRWVARRVMISQIPQQYARERAELMKGLGRETESTGQYDFEVYFPHLNFDRKSASKQMERGIDWILNNKTMSKEEKDREIKKIVIHHNQMTGDYMSIDKFGDHFDQVQGIMQDIAMKKKVAKEKITWFHNNKMGNQFSRVAHIDGWERTPEAYETYIKNIHDTYYRLASQIITKNEIVNWSYKNWLKAGGEPTPKFEKQIPYLKKLVNMKKEGVNMENFFRNLDWTFEGKDLWKQIKDTGADIQVLTGGKEIRQDQKARAKGKRGWVKDKLGDINTIVARRKAQYAKHNTILIDDFQGNVKAFQKAGGKAIHHTGDAVKTMKALEETLTHLSRYGSKVLKGTKVYVDLDGVLVDLKGGVDAYGRKQRTKGIKKEDADLINSWRTFFNLYTQGAMGYPTKIPEAVIKNPDMKLKGSFYAWTADSQVTKTMNRIANKLGVSKSDMQKQFPELGGPYDMSQIARISNMEAKYALASLLAHPKSAVANLYGGSVHTLIYTGYENLKKARDIDYLRAHVNPEWKTMKDVEASVKKAGVIEEFLMYEATLNPEVRGKKWGAFMSEAVSKIKQDPGFKDEALTSLANKHGISEALLNKAGWFMREPERILRRDSYIASLIQAREKFGGAIKEWNHPVIMEMAKKGVKATQFLYSAPFRPMFAATSLGKMLTRFQLWAWNAVRFRKDIINEANQHGWQEGTPEFARFQRLATADLFMMAMSNVFMYSLFESALPAPWSYFQDTADWLLGDETERDRAFFGAWPSQVAPLQMVTPPSLRLFPALFKGMVTDDYAKLADYTVWTMFPFGRIARDVVGPGGLLENPMRAVEKTTGLPYMQFSRQVTKHKDSEILHPEGF